MVVEKRRARPVRHPDLPPTHPGALLREIVVPATGRSKTEIARLLGVSRQTLHDLLAEKQVVTPRLAIRLGKMFGDGPEPWLRMQNAHDVWHATREMAAAIAAIPTIAA